MYSVPVKCDTHGGFGELQGMLLFDGYRLTLQYQTADSMFGVLRSDPKQIEIPLETLVNVRYSGGFCWLAPNVQLRLSDFSVVAQVPAVEGGRLKLSVRWSDRRDARRLVESLAAVCSERRFATLNAELDRMTASHPLGEARVSGRIKVPPPPPGMERES
jgi:hypothetical protein